MSRLAKRYARAIFEVARERDAVDAVAADLEQITAALRIDEVRALVLDPEVVKPQRLSVLEKLVSSGHELSRRLLEVVVERRREAILSEVSDAFAALRRADRGEVLGVVESAVPLGETQLRDLEQAASATVGKTVTLSVAVVPELIGGVRVRVGNTLYDGSVASQLEELELRLMEVPVP